MEQAAIEIPVHLCMIHIDVPEEAGTGVDLGGEGRGFRGLQPPPPQMVGVTV